MFLNLKPRQYKQTVIRYYPQAVCRQNETGLFRVYPDPSSDCPVGFGETARLAWADAARRVK